MVLSVKVFLNEHRQVRRWKIQSFAELESKIFRITQSKFKLEYLDNDLEWIVLESEDEWSEACDISIDCKDINPLIVRVVMKKEDSLQKNEILVTRSSTSTGPTASDSQTESLAPPKNFNQITPIESIINKSKVIIPIGSSQSEAIPVNKHVPKKLRSIEISQKSEPQEIKCNTGVEQSDQSAQSAQSAQFKNECNLLNDIGFNDQELNLKVLKHYEGNFAKAVSCLFYLSSYPKEDSKNFTEMEKLHAKGC